MNCQKPGHVLLKIALPSVRDSTKVNIHKSLRKHLMLNHCLFDELRLSVHVVAASRATLKSNFEMDP